MEGFEQLADAARGEVYDGAYEEAKTYFQLKHLDQVQFVVASIEPRKEEIDALTPDRVEKAMIFVPWTKGIVVKLLPRYVRRWKIPEDPNEPRTLEQYTLFEGSEPSNIVLNYDFYPNYDKLSERDITSGFLRIYNIVDGQLKTMKVTGFPVGFENWAPTKRFGFWWDTISRKFGLPERMEEGLAFWAYWNVRDLTHEKNPDGSQKYKYPFTEPVKVIKNTETGSYMEAITAVERVEVPIVREVVRILDAQRAARASEDGDKTPF